jgi:hypothetical protein
MRLWVDWCYECIMKKIVLASLTAALVAAVPLAVLAVGTNPAPLRVVSCVGGYLDETTPGLQAGLTNGVTVAVKNVSPKTIVGFSGGGVYDTTVIMDSFKQTVAPGETYTFTKHYTPFSYNGASAMCFVSAVSFSDGSTWAAPKP